MKWLPTTWSLRPSVQERRSTLSLPWKVERTRCEMSLDLGLAGKVAIVTGGSVGIGKETARKLAIEGVSVVIAARTMSTLESAAEQLRAQTGGTVVPTAVDTTNTQSVRDLVETTARRF